ncbi:uncharacterized protein LOC127807763 [Diospyros lotus]|uniref:uncharacterized protein LOC127807763 n=1 Tax=Diospyros lotus TaxID=55363 RepID=UPI0022594B9E|nr:uncharacterized protein LOC127807763 [Diospyros lotus]
MDLTPRKPDLLSNLLLRLLPFAVLIFAARFTYAATIDGCSCRFLQFCFSSSVPETVTLSAAELLRSLRTYYSSVFQDLITEGYLSLCSKAFCIETITGQDVASLKEIGVADSIGISAKPSPPLVISGRAVRQPFDDNTFGFHFSGVDGLDWSSQPAEFASEVSRTLKPGGFFVLHTVAKDMYSLNSLLELFNSCRLIRWRDINGPDLAFPSIREVILIKENPIPGQGEKNQN